MTALAQSTALPAPSPVLLRCLVLAVLLHLWLVLMLGNTPGGTAREGEGVWGAINITLRGPVTPGAAPVQPPQPVSPSGPAGAAPEPRWGGTVREAAPAALPEPGAAQLGDWSQRPLAPALSAMPPWTGVPSVPAPTALPPLRTPEALATPPLPSPLDPVLEERLPSRPAPLPALPRMAVPELPPLPAALPAPPTLAAALRSPERSLVSPLRETPPPGSLAPLENIPQAVAPGVPPAVNVPALAPPLEAPIRQLTAPAPAVQGAAAPLTPLEPMSSIAPALPAGGDTAIPSLQPLPAAPGPALTTGAPDAGARVGHDIATPPGAAASAPPRLNLQLARPRGGELSRMGGSGLLPVLPRPPEVPDKLAEDIRKSARPDCREAYAGAGLLAVVPLAADALRKGGCKW